MSAASTEFVSFPKIPRYFRNVIISEKIDGTNAQVHVLDDGVVLAGSRTRYITPESDNFGFAAWVLEHEAELRELGPGRHYGEWMGAGIQRGYGLDVRKFVLFNSARWMDARPACCDVVPVLFSGGHSNHVITQALAMLETQGSAMVPGFMNPEGVCIFHVISGHIYKMTIGDDLAKERKVTQDEHQGQKAAAGMPHVVRFTPKPPTLHASPATSLFDAAESEVKS